MDYTLAIVDEGLLGLTNFKTPNLRDVFYQREALGVSTWDLFDEVAGAYGGELDRLLALGGSDAAKPTNPDEGKSRFPPVVKFLGPFSLKAGEKRAAQRGPARIRGRGARDGGGRQWQRLWLGGEIRVRAPGADDPADDCRA